MLIRLNGEAHDEFSVTSRHCDAAGKSCFMNIAFAPKETNTRRATISVAPDDNTPPIEVELQGVGKSPNVFKRFGRWMVGLFTDESAKYCPR